MLAQCLDADFGLNTEQLKRYWSDGIVYPLFGLDPAEASSLVPEYERLSQRMAHWTTSKQLIKTHLVAPWVYELVTLPSIVGAVESVLGEDIMVWGATFFVKPPGDNALHVGWHQDLTYWGLQPADSVLTVWLALSEASEANGAMQAVKCSHRKGSRLHVMDDDATNMLMNNQSVSLSDSDRSEIDVVELMPGEFSMHHSLTLHGSAANRTGTARVGLSINYIAASVVQQKNGGYDSAMLVRGEDRHGNFEHEQHPLHAFSHNSLRQYRRSIMMPSGLGAPENMVYDIVNFDSIN